MKFVRAPTGLVSELESYLIKLGYTGVPKQELVETDNKLKEVEKKIDGVNADLKKAPVGKDRLFKIN